MNDEQPQSVVPRSIFLNKSRAALICGFNSFSFRCQQAARFSRNRSWSACFARLNFTGLPAGFGASVNKVDTRFGFFVGDALGSPEDSGAGTAGTELCSVG